MVLFTVSDDILVFDFSHRCLSYCVGQKNNWPGKQDQTQEKLTLEDQRKYILQKGGEEMSQAGNKKNLYRLGTPLNYIEYFILFFLTYINYS